MAGEIRVGIGGWTYAPWRGPFYPPGWPQSRELGYAAERLTAIEINATYYGPQKPASFARWRAAVPAGFVFAVKGPRYATSRRVLAGAGPAIERFLGGGVLELAEKLGPINWQFLPAKRFEPADFAAFLDLLPAQAGGRPLRHAVEVRHDSFRDPAFVALLRDRGIGVVVADSDTHPQIADLTAPFVYARLQRAEARRAAGYAPAALDRWAARARLWAEGRAPDDLAPVAPAARAARGGRDVFLFMINGFKPKAPAAAMALLARLAAKPKRA